MQAYIETLVTAIGQPEVVADIDRFHRSMLSRSSLRRSSEAGICAPPRLYPPFRRIEVNQDVLGKAELW
jgi:hypothetical protein